MPSLKLFPSYKQTMQQINHENAIKEAAVFCKPTAIEQDPLSKEHSQLICHEVD